MSSAGHRCNTRHLSLLAVLMNTRQPISMEHIFRVLPGDYLPVGESWEDQDRTVQESTRRKFSRDIQLLRSLGYRITCVHGEDDEHAYRLENPPNRKAAALSPEDLSTLRLLADIRPLIRESPLNESLRMAFARIDALAQNLPPEPGNDAIIFTLREVGKPILAPQASEAVLASVWMALRERCALELTYRSAHGTSPEVRTVDPWGLFLKTGVWYLVGWCRLRKARRVFALHRASRAEALSGTASAPAPADFSIARWASLEPWELPMHGPIEVTLEMDDVVAGLRHSRLRSARATRQGSDGAWQIQVTASNIEPLVGLVLSLWGHARVLSPPEVCQRLEAAVDRLIQNHGEEIS